MNLNHVTAEITFETSVIHKIEANCSKYDILEETEKRFGMDIKCSKPVEIGEKKIGNLLMQIDVSIGTEDDVDTIQLVIEGVFSSNKEIEDSKFMELLNLNGGAALYSIARAKIENISGLIYNTGKLLLPMINIIQFFQEKSKNSKNDSN